MCPPPPDARAPAATVLALPVTRRAPLPPPGPTPEPASEADVAASHALAPRRAAPLGQLLIEDGAVDPGDMLKATVLRRRQSAPLGEILLAHGWVTEAALTRALSRQHRTSIVDLAASPPDPRLIDAIGAEACLAAGIVPWRRVGGVTWVATARPEDFAALVPTLPASFGAVRMLLAEPAQARRAVLECRRFALIRQAERRVPAALSCRPRPGVGPRGSLLVLGLLAGMLAALALAPVATATALTAWAAATLLGTAVLKGLAFRAALEGVREDRALLRAIAAGQVPAPQMTGPLPVISVMVPLFRESDIAGTLVARLGALTYPRALTDILLVVEDGDAVTAQALDRAFLPPWITVVRVPAGPVQTKPRALTYGLNFCRGSIVGVWDAEDRPDPDQLHAVARGFALAPADTACLQGILDYYNPRSNWLARCFTIEYAAWFRALLPGIARLGLVVPLGGTTMFIRRDVLEELGGWDAWNVTEDADLGVRLARRGWRTRMLDSVTDEEANCRTRPWIVQRSRWLKGYAMTWGVHMRDPVQLWRDLGPRRFVAFQVQFLATLSQYLLTPVMASFWLLALGLPHPLRPVLGDILGGNAVPLVFTLFVLSEALSLAVAFWAVRGRRHRHLLAFVPTLHVYFPLGCIAAWKAIAEVVTRPFHWHKTAHGLFEATLPGAVAVPEGTGPAAGLPGTMLVPVLGAIRGRSLDEVAGDGARMAATPPRPVAAPEAAPATEPLPMRRAEAG